MHVVVASRRRGARSAHVSRRRSNAVAPPFAAPLPHAPVLAADRRAAALALTAVRCMHVCTCVCVCVYQLAHTVAWCCIDIAYRECAVDMCALVVMTSTIIDHSYDGD